MVEKLIFEKTVDKSVLIDGITIPQVYHETLYSHLNNRLEHGQSMSIQIIINGMVYIAQLRNLGFDTQKYSNHHDILQIRYTRNSPIANALREVFAKTQEKVEQQTISNGSRKRIVIPTREQEYIMIYAVPGETSLLLDPVVAGDISQEMDQLTDMPELMIEELLSVDETAGIKEKVRITKIRRMNHAIGDTLKSLYGYRCQICGAYIGEAYGSQVIHAHHIDYFSHSLNNDATNIMIVCPNHHAIIHDKNPEFNSKEKTYRYPNGYVEGLALNKHL